MRELYHTPHNYCFTPIDSAEDNQQMNKFWPERKVRKPSTGSPVRAHGRGKNPFYQDMTMQTVVSRKLLMKAVCDYFTHQMPDILGIRNARVMRAPSSGN